jgi:hypothetical protein
MDRPVVPDLTSSTGSTPGSASPESGGPLGGDLQKKRELLGRLQRNAKPPSRKLRENQARLMEPISREVSAAAPAIAVSLQQMKFGNPSLKFSSDRAVQVTPTSGGLFHDRAAGPWVEIEPPGVEIEGGVDVWTIAPELANQEDLAARAWEIGLVQAVIGNDQYLDYENSVVRIVLNSSLDYDNERSRPFYNRSCAAGPVPGSGRRISPRLFDRPSMKPPLNLGRTKDEQNPLRKYTCKETFAVWLIARKIAPPHDVFYCSNLVWETDYSVAFDGGNEVKIGGVGLTTPANLGQGVHTPPFAISGSALNNTQAQICETVPPFSTNPARALPNQWQSIQIDR